MTKGTIAERQRKRYWVPVVLVVLIAVCTGLIIFAGPGKLVTTILTVVSAVGGAALGSLIRADLSGDLVRNQARPATRELFDHSYRLGVLVQLSEGYRVLIDESLSTGTQIEEQRVADWLGMISVSLRAEITSTASAIENWGDLAKDVLEAERVSYIARQQLREPAGTRAVNLKPGEEE